jgi:Ca2+-binding RTX toxin-like protein
MSVYSGSVLGLATGSDFSTIIAAPGAMIGGVEVEHFRTQLINYGTLGGATATVAGPAVFFASNGNGTFVNKADGVVLAAHSGSVPTIQILGEATIINEGTILSNGHAVEISGPLANYVQISNSGDIYSGQNGIWLAGANAQYVTITNSGEIWGDANGIHMQFAVGAAPVIINTGVITGRGSSIIATDGDRLNVTNYGTLDGNVVGTSLGQTDIVTNNGRIVGSVSLGSGIDIYRGAGVVVGTVFGEDGNDALTGGNAADKFQGGNQNDTLTGNGGNDLLKGDAGNDTLFGGAGKDDLTGGLNNDFFVFNTALNASTNLDTVRDFSHANDTFKLENAIFTKLGAGVHALSSAFFRVGAKALDANDYIVYNQANGVLSYDNDGNGAHAAIAFAVIANRPALAYNDFLVF